MFATNYFSIHFTIYTFHSFNAKAKCENFARKIITPENHQLFLYENHDSVYIIWHSMQPSYETSH